MGIYCTHGVYNTLYNILKTKNMWLYSGQTEPQGYGLNPCEGQFLQCFVLHYEKPILSSCVQVDVSLNPTVDIYCMFYPSLSLPGYPVYIK